MLRDHTDKLQDLWRITKKDWYLEVSQCLTEPTCPVAIVAAEGSNALRYAVHADTIEEAIAGAVDLAYRELVLGQHIEPVSPITNPDDRDPDMPWNQTGALPPSVIGL